MPSIARIDVRTLTDQACQKLEAAIVKGELAPGTRITEVKLAKTFGISRGPLREALQRLEGRKLVSRIPHVGVRVVELSPRDVLQLFEIREALEGMACRLATEHIDDADLAALATILEAHRKSADLKSGHGYFQRAGPRDFHFTIVRASRNQRLIDLIDNEFYYPLRVYRYLSSVHHGRAQDAYREHTEILEAMRARDADRAEAMMRLHLAKARLHLEQTLVEEAEAAAIPAADDAGGARERAV